MTETHDAFTSLSLRGLTLRGRITKPATFEGMCPGGEVSDALVEHHRRIAQGGAAMTTVAYCSVSRDGRTYDSQMLMGAALVPQLQRLTAAVHGEGAAAAIQLGHCGYFADKKVIGVVPIGPSRMFNTYGLSFCRAMDHGDIARVTAEFASAAERSIEAGFDAVELHLGHGYLLSQFLSPHTNRRDDEYGGSLEGRLRFPLEVVAAVRAAVGERFPVLAKVNVTDGFDGGLDTDDAVAVAVALEAAGVDALVLSGGFVSKTPMFVMRGEVPLRDMVAVQESLVRKVGLTLFGKIFVQAYPYRPLYFFEQSKRIRAAVAMPLVVIGGVKHLEDVETCLEAGFPLVAMGRALLHDPDLPNAWRAGDRRRSGCEPCNKCIAEMDRGGVRCVLPSASSVS